MVAHQVNPPARLGLFSHSQHPLQSRRATALGNVFGFSMSVSSPSHAVVVMHPLMSKREGSQREEMAMR